MFKTRLISGIVLVAAAVLSIGVGGWLLFFVLAAVSAVGMLELYRAMGVCEKQLNLLAVTGFFGAALYYAATRAGVETYGLASLVLAMILLLAVYVFSYPKYQAEQVMAAFFGIVYVAVMLSFIFLAREIGDNGVVVWLVFICSWGCDTCAYCVGMLIGKHKMAPILSPKKSIEGAVGGVAGAAILGVIYASVNHRPMLEYAVISVAGALISMVGDLAASAIKRNKGIKDYGKLIPGHGGVLDRFDSVIITAPVIYYLAKFILKI